MVRAVIYSYRTPFGVFRIKPNRANPARVELWMGAECYGSYPSARMAASDVAAHSTSHTEWDMATHLTAPEDLAGWLPQ